ncbi:uncharacterized protein JCM6883_001339 [Sporobolomyces salmoneus]|uniref:uncharacterized protein n=1 Tax=Sporobolomyces salmoneus TaxID=183962 RepID=UPI00316B2882
MAFRAVEQLISYSGFRTLEQFHGSNLSRVFLNGVKIDTEAIAGLIFPSLQILGLHAVFFRPDPLPAASFPALRHLGFDNKGVALVDEEKTTLISLLPQLHSMILVSDVLLRAMPVIPSLPLASILVNHPWPLSGELDGLESGVVNLRLLLADTLGIILETSCGSMIDSFVSLLRDPHQFACLKSVYLPSRDALPIQCQTPDILAAIDNVARAAKDRNVLVVIEEQSERPTGECQISEDFRRRMTLKRVEKDDQTNVKK